MHTTRAAGTPSGRDRRDPSRCGDLYGERNNGVFPGTQEFVPRAATVLLYDIQVSTLSC